VRSTTWVGDTLDGAGTWSLRAKVPWLLGLMMLFDSWDSVVVAFLLPVLKPMWGLTDMQASLLPFFGFGGQFVGAIVFGSLSERYGRLPVLKLMVLAMSVLAVGCAMAGSFEQLLVIRAIQGLAIGGALPVAISYINEVAPTATRGRFFGTFQFLMVSGFVLANLAAKELLAKGAVPEAYGWRIMFALGALPLLLLPFTRAFPESPRWLAARGRADEAARSLQKLGSGAVPAAEARTTTQGDDEKIPFSMLFAPEVRKTSVVIVLLWFLTSLVSFGMQTWVPSLYTRMFNIPISEALSYNLVATLAVLVLPLILRFSIDRVGRRPLPLIGTAIGGIALVALIFVDRSATLLVVTLSIIGQIGISIGSMVLWPITAETYPTRIRAMALGVSSSVARAASSATQLMVGSVLAWTQSASPVFLAFGIASFAVSMLWLFGTRETAGRKMTD
jgi:MFS transporter, putative metabolite:H+ symporter